MVGHAFRVDEFPYKLHAADEQHIATLHQLVRGSVPGQHLDL